MTYLYTKTNRLEEPHNYMYTKFEGASLLQSFQSARLEKLEEIIMVNYRCEASRFEFNADLIAHFEKLFDRNSPISGDKFRTLLSHENRVELGGGIEVEKDDIKTQIYPLLKFTDLETVSTIELLQSLIDAHLSGGRLDLTKKWTDRLIQRFEVTKKIYETYPPGFRKGEGKNTDVQLYWLFALNLSLYYVDTQQIKYLSTLLKVCDLLCSLPENLLYDHVSSNTMSAILAAEIISIQMLAEDRGV